MVRGGVVSCIGAGQGSINAAPRRRLELSLEGGQDWAGGGREQWELLQGRVRAGGMAGSEETEEVGDGVGGPWQFCYAV